VSTEPTIRDRIRIIERAMLQGGLHPAQAREFLSVATALLGSCNREVTEADLAFNDVLASHKAKEKSAASARIVAEATIEYRRKRYAEDEQANCEEIIKTLKVVVRSLDSEMHLTPR
jgi:hypothetical protein